MKSLAAFKRHIKPGQKWHAYHHLPGKDLGVREVAKVNSVGFYLYTVKTDGTIGQSFMDFPKSDLIEFNDDGSVTIFWPASVMYDQPRRAVLTYKQVYE